MIKTIVELVFVFQEEYFKVYDSDNRQALLDAYHENAMMSMSASYPPSVKYFEFKFKFKLEEFVSFVVWLLIKLKWNAIWCLIGCKQLYKYYTVYEH